MSRFKKVLAPSSQAALRTRRGTAGMGDGAASPFKITGTLSVQESATVICLRNRGPRPGARLQRSRFLEGSEREVTGGNFAKSLESIFGDLPEIDFSQGWEVLMGQSECVNWVRSKGPEMLKTMRYAGEYKLAGGNRDEGESFFEAGRRELEEEFLRPAGLALPSNAVIRPFVVKQTMPVQSKSNIMWNMVALEDENPWLRSLDVPGANAKLQARREAFQGLLDTGRFWKMDEAQREAVAPEVHELAWLPLEEAVFCTLSTMVAGGRRHHVNEWQAAELARLGVQRRDPMFMTACVLLELLAFPDSPSLASDCQERMSDEAMQEERERVQWLFPGMGDADLARRREPAGMVKDAKTLLALRTKRERARVPRL